MKKKAIAAMLMCIMSFTMLTAIQLSAKSETVKYDNSRIIKIADEIVNWKKMDNGSEVDGNLINNEFLELAGTTPGDWFPFGLGRLNIPDAYDGYLAVIKQVVQSRYKEPCKLSAAKATEWHRISLAVLAMGGDPTMFGKREDGESINLIADGTYDRGKSASLGRQGINGWIWGLIALDSNRYEVSKDSYNTRDDIIIEILCQQLNDGGFALSGKIADPDITAMAVQALAPYYNSENVYSYKQKSSDRFVSNTVRQIVDESLICLSNMQLSSGDYKSWGTQNVESTDQVVVALCSLGVDPQTDKRFIKDGNTLIDGIMRYQMKDGGFVHSYIYDEENPTSLPDKSNTMASEQTLYTMAAISRRLKEERTLYDFRAEQSTDLKQRISSLEISISSLSEKSDKSTLEELLKTFYSIPENERSYVCNYWSLSDKAKKLNIDISEIAGETLVIESPKDNEENEVILYFVDSDKKIIDEMIKPLTTEQYVTVTRLLEKLNNSENFPEKDYYLEKLNEAKKEISVIQSEIEAIKKEVFEKLYPFENMSLLNKPVVDNLLKRYNALSEYDKGKIDRWEDVLKTKTKIDNLLRAIVISTILLIIIIALSILMVKNMKKRRRKKQTDMDALAALYEEDE